MSKSSRIIDGLKTNTLYSFYVRAKNSVGHWSDLPTAVTHTTIKDTTAPAVLSSITLLMLAGMFQLKWGKPSTLDLRGGGYKIYVYTSNTPASAVLIREVGYTANAANILIGEQSLDLSITIAAGTTYFFWVTTLDDSGNESAKVATTPGSGSVSVVGTGLDHGALTGLADDDHPQYRLESADHSHQSTGLEAGQLDHGLAMVAASLLDDDHTQYQLESLLPTVAPVILSTTTGIDAKTVATTNLYTVPAGKSAIITSAVIHVTVADTITVVPTLGIGIAAGEDDIIAPVALTGLDATTKFWRFSVEGITKVGAATEVIKLGIDVGATATTMTIAVDLIGYLI